MDLNYIGGEWVPSRSGRTLASCNPTTGETLGIVPASDASDVDAACRAARAAFDRWRLTPAPRRAEILFRAAELLRERKEALARLMSQEMGKVLEEARGDVQEAIDMTLFAAGEGRRLLGYTTPAEMPDKFAMAVREPVGVVAAITPWNFPLAIPSWKLMPALVAGNTCVFKPAEDTPLCACRLVELLEEAGLPPGVLNLVHGRGEEAGAALVRHPEVDLVSFTGGTDTGREVATAAAASLKRTVLEMGGKNAVIVLEDADLDLAVDGITWSAFGTSGQRCTAASRVLIHTAVFAEVRDRLVARAEALRLGDPLDPAVQVGPLVNAAQLERVAGYVALAREEGARVLCGGERATTAPLDRGYYFRPTYLDCVTPAMRVAQEEIFGPVTCLIPVRDLDEAIQINNSVAYGLSSGIFTRDLMRAFRAMRELRTGIVYLNAGTIGAEVHLPFGGMRATGNGHREAGQAMLDAVTEWKSVYVEYSGRLQRAQIDRD